MHSSGSICPNPWSFILPSWTARIAGADWGCFQLRVKNHTHGRSDRIDGANTPHWAIIPTAPCLGDALQTLKAPRGSDIDDYWCFPLIQRAKQGGEGWKSLSAVVFHCWHPPSPAVWEGRCSVISGEEQVREQNSQAMTKSGSTRFNWGLSDRDTSSCHLCLSRTGHSWSHLLQGKAFPCATRLSTQEQGWHKNGADSPRNFPATMNKARKGGN